MFKGRISICELMNMPFKMYNSMYKAAWQESVDKAKEAEEAEKRAKEEEKQAKRQAGKQQMTSRQMIEAGKSTGAGLGLGDIDLEDAAEELGLM